MGKFATFSRYATREEAGAVASVLQQHGIASQIEVEQGLLDEHILGTQYSDKILLRISDSDFAKAQAVILEETKVDLAEVDEDYMLLTFTDDELKDVIAKPDEWGAYNYNVALALLQQRGVQIDKHDEAALHTKRIDELSVPRELDDNWLLMGYGFSTIGIAAGFTGSTSALMLLYSFSLLPGLLGIVLGLYIIRTKRILPDGTQMYSFSEKARKHGLYMIILALVCIILTVLRGFSIQPPGL